MKKQALVFATTIMCAAASFGSIAFAKIFNETERETATQLRETALNSSLSYELLESLTTEVGPRLAGSPQDRLAVEWMQAQLNELGFDKVWIEPVEIPHWERISEQASIIAPYPQKMHVTSLGLSVGTPEDGITAEIAHFDSYNDLLEATEDEVAGKIVFISNRMERAKNGSGYGAAVVARALGPSEAAKRGALALIIRSIGTDSHRVPHTGSLRYDPEVKMIPAAALSNPDADILENQLKRGLPVTFHLNMQNEMHGQTTSYNVIGEITGSARPDEIILIGGHLDSWDLGTGAVDDGAGIAITMAAAKLVSDLPEAPSRTIRVVGWAAEEIGLWGGNQYAVAHSNNVANHIIGAESDFGAGPVWRIASGVSAAGYEAIKEIHSVLEPLGIELGPNTGANGPDISAMVRAGMPAVSLNQDGTKYFDLHHTADDTFDKVDPAELAQNVAAYAVFIYLTSQYEGTFNDTQSPTTEH